MSGKNQEKEISLNDDPKSPQTDTEPDDDDDGDDEEAPPVSVEKEDDEKPSLMERLLMCCHGRDIHIIANLHDASAKGNKAEVLRYLDVGEDIDSTSWKLKGLQVFMPSMRRRQVSGDAPLHLAVINNHFPIVKLLINEGANVNIRNNDGLTPLHMAVVNKFHKAVRFLIRHGADVNARDKWGCTPLHAAATHGRTGTCVYLVSVGGDLSLEDKLGNVPLHFAAENGKVLTVAKLIELGSLINAKNVLGLTPLHAAVSCQDDDRAERMAVELIKHGAQPNVKNEIGLTAMHLATPRVQYAMEHTISNPWNQDDGEIVVSHLVLDDYLSTNPTSGLVTGGDTVKSSKLRNKMLKDFSVTGDHARDLSSAASLSDKLKKSRSKQAARQFRPEELADKKTIRDQRLANAVRVEKTTTVSNVAQAQRKVKNTAIFGARESIKKGTPSIAGVTKDAKISKKAVIYARTNGANVQSDRRQMSRNSEMPDKVAEEARQVSLVTPHQYAVRKMSIVK